LLGPQQFFCFGDALDQSFNKIGSAQQMFRIIYPVDIRSENLRRNLTISSASGMSVALSPVGPLQTINGVSRPNHPQRLAI
jgi:hypothetical protein